MTSKRSTYVTSQVEQLAPRRKTLSDLLINLFAACMAVPDKKFVEYVESMDKFDEGEDVTTKKLMQVALIKYKDRKRADKWQAPSVEEEQIIAWTAQIGDLKNASATQTGTAENMGKKSTVSKMGEGKKNRTSRFAEKYAWKLVPPAAGKPTTKEMDKKTYHFCMHHNNGAGAWSSQHKGKKPTDKVMLLTKVLQAIQDEACELSSDEDK